MEQNSETQKTEENEQKDSSQKNFVHNPFAMPPMGGSCCASDAKAESKQEKDLSPQGGEAGRKPMNPFAGPLSSPNPAPQPEAQDEIQVQGPSTSYMLKSAVIVVLWYALMSNVVPISVWLTYTVLGLEAGTSLASAVEFFTYDVAKILLLLVAMVYIIAVIRASLNVDRVRDFLQGRGRFVGHFLAAVFGSITPFCSCSSIPLFLGFTTAGIPIGVTMSFLITSPIINEVAVVLLGGLLGWKFTVAYIVVGILAGVLGGYFMSAIKADRWFQPEMKEHLRLMMNSRGFGGMGGLGSSQSVKKEVRISLWERHLFGLDETLKIFKKVWLWVIVGVGVGAGLHGYVPEAWITDNLHAGQWWTVPVAVAAGIPLYGSATGIVPVMESLLLKGLPMGTTLALCMSTIAISLPELLMLKQVMQVRLLVVFASLMFVLFTLVGWLFNLLAPYMV